MTINQRSRCENHSVSEAAPLHGAVAATEFGERGDNYPDVSIICRPNPQQDTFQDDPSVIIEVLSDSTRRVDEGEKKDAYLTIPKLSAYILLEQNACAASCYRRREQEFQLEYFAGEEAVIDLPSVEATLSLSDAYEGVQLKSS